MAISYKFLDRPKTIEDAIGHLERDIVPLLGECWNARGKNFYHADILFDVQTFSTLWLGGGLSLVIAYDEDKPVGIFIGVKFRPMLFQARVLQVETCYGQTPAIEQGLYEYVASVLNVMGVDELWVQDDINQVPGLDGFMAQGSYRVTRLVKR